MPPAKNKSAPGLDIVFAPGTPTVLHPGQNLSGTVTLSTTEESVSIGSVTVTFYGRAKAKVFQNYGQSSAVYRSRATFFNIEQQLFKSDYTYGPSEHSWPFSIELPFVADESCLKGKKRDRFKPHNNYLSTDTLDVIEHELPPPMYHYHGMWGRACWGFVEYVLEATVTEAQGTHTIRSPQSRSAVRPLNFQPLRREDVLADYAMQIIERRVTLKSSRLSAANPNNALTPTTSIGRTSPQPSPDPILPDPPISTLRNLLSRVSLSSSSSSTPRLTLACTISHPTILQVYHPDPIPFVFSVSPILANPNTATNSNIDNLTLPQIRITSFSFHVICKTTIRALTGLWQEHDSKTVNIPLAKDVPLNHLLTLSSTSTSSDDKKGLTFSNTLTDAARTSSHEAAATSLNLSTLHPLHLRAAKLGRVHEHVLNPTFKTYNVARSFGLKWAVEVEVVLPPGAGSEGAGGGAGAEVLAREKLKGEVPVGGVSVRGCPDGVREGLAGEDGLVSYEELVGRDEDEDDEEGGQVRGGNDEKVGLLEVPGHGGAGEGESRNLSENGSRSGGGEGKTGKRGFWRRSFDGGNRVWKEGDKDKEKEEYAREDRERARIEERDGGTGGGGGGHGEELPRYEA